MNRIVPFVCGLVIAPAAAVAQPAPRPLPAPAAMAAPVQAPEPPAPPAAPAAPAPVAAPAPPVPPAEAWHFPFEFAMPLDIDIPHFEMPDIDIHLDELATNFNFDAGPWAVEIADAARNAGREAQLAVQSGVAELRGRLTSANAYNRGLDALQERQYDRAIEAFDRVIAEKGARADGALYWKAFSQFRLGQTSGALESIAALRRDHAGTKYLNDARVLETDIKQQAGQPVDPAQFNDDEIKLLAIQGLQRTDQVVPLLRDVLGAANSLNVKKRALYVLALSDLPDARALLEQYAKGAGTPDLQVEAIRYLTSQRSAAPNRALLREIYGSAGDATVKREVLNAYMRLGRRRAAPGGSTAQADTGVTDDLVALYRQETDDNLKRQILAALGSMGSTASLVPILKGESNAAMKRQAIQAIGNNRSEASTKALVDLYTSSPDAGTREAIAGVLAGHQDAATLITLARQESDMRVKTAIVRHLSNMAPKSDAAAAYLAEVLR